MEDTIEDLIQEALKDTDFNDFDLALFLLQQYDKRQKSTVTLTSKGLLRIGLVVRKEMDAFRAKQRQMNDASELTNREALLRSLQA